VTPDEALRRVRDPHEVLSMTDVELTEAAVTLAAEVEHLRVIEGRVIDLLYSADADIAQLLYYGHHLEWDENCAEDGEYWIYPGGKPKRPTVEG
jgi:hypothetical protein